MVVLFFVKYLPMVTITTTHITDIWHFYPIIKNLFLGAILSNILSITLSIIHCNIAIAFRYGLDPTDEKQRKMAAAYLLEMVSWTGISSDFKISLTSSRTQQLCDAMTVSKDLMANLFLAAGGKGGISTGGGGSSSELTNWDGTKKNTGWGM